MIVDQYLYNNYIIIITANSIFSIFQNNLFFHPFFEKKNNYVIFYKQSILSPTLPHSDATMNSGEVTIKLVASTYRIGKKIDEGAFGKIYRGTKIRGSGQEFAIKMESMKQEHPQLVTQCKLYNMLHSDPLATDRGIPRVYACGVQDQYNFLVMDLMGPSLQSLLTGNPNSRKFSLKTVLMLIDQMISRIEYLHSRSLLHRDIKPDNFCMGINSQKSKLFVLDFGLAKKYVMPNGKHIPYKEGKSLTGTARYASINTHRGLEQACRDDMESIGYVALYCLKGSLPWQGQKGGTKENKYLRIKETKINTTVETLCKGCPEEFIKYLNAVKKLEFEEKPNYPQYKKIFRDLFNRNGYQLDFEYDWAKQKQPLSDTNQVLRAAK